MKLILIELKLMCKLYMIAKIIKAWEFKPLLCLFNFIYLLCFKFVNVLDKFTIDDGG